MTIYIVTIKLKPDIKKYGKSKRKFIGECRFEKHVVCDDCNGLHHSFLHFESDNGRGIADGYVREKYEKEGYHVTRVEMV